MSIITNHFDLVPSEVVHEITLQLSSKDLCVFRMACKKFNEIFCNYWSKAFDFWNKSFISCFAFNPDYAQTAHLLSEVILQGSNANTAHKISLKKRNKLDKKILQLISDKTSIQFSQLQRNNNEILSAESNLQQAEFNIAGAAKNLTIAFQSFLRDIKVSPSGPIDNPHWLKLDSCFAFLSSLLHKFVEESSQQAFIKEKIKTVYSTISQSTYLWMIDEFVNSKEPLTETRYKSMTNCLTHHKLVLELNKKLKEKHGNNCLNFHE